MRLVSEARQIIARANARFPCITAALLQKCSAAHLPKPNFADLPPTVVIEAARAVMNQEAVLAALLASAIAESASHGNAGKRAVEELSETFDQTGQDMIELNRVTCALNTCDITLGVYPIGQIALAIYFKQHAPTQAGGPDVEGAAAAVDFYCDGVFNPKDAIKEWNARYCEARVIQFEYNITSVVAHLTRAMNVT